MKYAPLALLLLLTACGSAQDRPIPVAADTPPTNDVVAAPAGKPEPAAFAKPPKAAPLTLVAGDVLHITVFRQKDLELEVRIPEDGSFAYPLIGDVQAAGRTVKSIEADMRPRLEEKYLYRAGVNITVRDFAPRMVYLLGGVTKPGGYEIHPNRRLTILQLISTGGGYTDRAQKEYAQLIRRNEKNERELV